MNIYCVKRPWVVVNGYAFFICAAADEDQAKPYQSLDQNTALAISLKLAMLEDENKKLVEENRFLKNMVENAADKHRKDLQEIISYALTKTALINEEEDD